MSKSVVKRILFYLVLFSLLFTLFSSTFFTLTKVFTKRINPSAGNLSEKLGYYLANKNLYDTLFLGDSRTYTNIQPDILDPISNRRSYNMAHWANWFPSQYAMLVDFVDQIPKQTTVIWSIGSQNFNDIEQIPVFPIGWKNITVLGKLGESKKDLIQLQLKYSSVTFLYFQRKNLLNRIDSLLSKVLVTYKTRGKNSDSLIESNIIAKFKNKKHVLDVIINRSKNGELVSIAERKNNGAYLRTEIVPKYYRDHQVLTNASQFLPSTMVDKNGKPKKLSKFITSESKWNIFVDMLRMFEKNGVNVIVNVFEEAPYVYGEFNNKNVYNNFMDGKVKSKIEEFGHQYIHLDFNKFKNEHFFDFNHMNTKGVLKFSPLFANKIKKD